MPIPSPTNPALTPTLTPTTTPVPRGLPAELELLLNWVVVVPPKPEETVAVELGAAVVITVPSGAPLVAKVAFGAELVDTEQLVVQGNHVINGVGACVPVLVSPVCGNTGGCVPISGLGFVLAAAGLRTPSIMCTTPLAIRMSGCKS
jgi:hypothetical protein